MNVQENIIALLKSHNISYKLYTHGPILNYEDAEKEQSIYKWEWIESKSVFMTNKKGKYYLFVTVQWKNVDFKKMKELIWVKLSIATKEEVEEVALCTPWCVAPFWLDDTIQMIVDEEIFKHKSYLFSPGISTDTLQLDPKDLRGIFALHKDTLFIGSES